MVSLPLLRALALAGLTLDEREAWVDRRIVGRTFASIGLSLTSEEHPDGVSRDTVRRLEEHARKKLAAYFESPERMHEEFSQAA